MSCLHDNFQYITEIIIHIIIHTKEISIARNPFYCATEKLPPNLQLFVMNSKHIIINK